MTLPESRNTTYAQGVQIKSADLNDIQDQIIGGKHGDKVLMLPGCAFVPASGGNPPVALDGILIGNAGGTGQGNAPLPLHVGDRIKSIVVYVYEDAAAAFTATYYAIDVTTQSGSTLDSGTDASGGAGTTTDTCDITGINYTLTATGAAYIKIAIPTGAANHVVGAAITYDRP